MSKTKKWFLYIIETKTGKLYTGITTDIERRFKQHLTGKGGAKFFRSNSPKKVVFKKSFKNRSEASKEEWNIKQLPRTKKLSLIRRYSDKSI